MRNTNKIDFKELGRTISVHCALLGMTQNQLATCVHASKRHIAGIETGTAFSMDLLFDLVDTLAIPGDEIFRPAMLHDPLVEKRAVATNLLLKCNEAQLNIAVTLLVSMFENIIPGGIHATAAETADRRRCEKRPMSECLPDPPAIL